jgi:hypothetical protein
VDVIEALFDRLWDGMYLGFLKAKQSILNAFGELIGEMAQSVGAGPAKLLGLEEASRKLRGRALLMGKQYNGEILGAMRDFARSGDVLEGKMAAAGNAFGEALATAKDVVNTEVAPVINKIFGEGSSKVTGIFSIFENLLEKFTLNDRIAQAAPEEDTAVAASVAAASKIAFESRGTFSGRAAAQLTDTREEGLFLSKQQISVLKDIRQILSVKQAAPVAVMGT